MTAPRPAPRAILWGACERCRGGGEPSPVDDRFCALCWPSLEDLRGREVVAAHRVRLAKDVANRPEGPEVLTPVPPDAEHIWLSVRGRPVAHLFLDDEATSYCGRAWLGRRARADVDPPVPEDATACRACWRSYRSGRRGP